MKGNSKSKTTRLTPAQEFGIKGFARLAATEFYEGKLGEMDRDITMKMKALGLEWPPLLTLVEENREPDEVTMLKLAKLSENPQDNQTFTQVYMVRALVDEYTQDLMNEPPGVTGIEGLGRRRELLSELQKHEVPEALALLQQFESFLREHIADVRGRSLGQ